MITGRRRVVAPTDPVVSLSEMYLHLRLDTEGSPPTHPEDLTLAVYIQAATDTADAGLEGDGWVGRAFMPQTFAVTLDGFPSVCERNPDAALFLPYPPLIDVLAVQYRGQSDGVYVQLDAAEYETVIEGDPHGYVRPVFGGSWPLAAERRDAVRVLFRCGYDETTSPPTTLPDAIKHYVMVLAGLMYQHREIDLTNAQLQPIANFHAAAQRFRVYGP